jgi:hypothetical protein
MLLLAFSVAVFTSCESSRKTGCPADKMRKRR